MSSQLDINTLQKLELPQKSAARLKAHLDSILRAMGDEIHALCVYGSLVRGEWLEKTSDINLLVVLDHQKPGCLDRLGAALTKSAKKARISHFVVSPTELKEASDVFCIKFDALRRNHLCVAGEDPFKTMKIADEHLRFVCEFRLRNTAMRLRRSHIETLGNKRLEQAQFIRLFTSALFPLRTLGRLNGANVPKTVFEDFSFIADFLAASPEVLKRLTTVRKTQHGLSGSELATLHADFRVLIDQAVECAEKLRLGRSDTKVDAPTTQPETTAEPI